jgi:hypothetical protein
VEVKQIVAELDHEIVRLREARALLAGASPNGHRRGRPAAKTVSIRKKPRKHNLSPEGRKRISDALKRRWAERRKNVAKQAKAA